jgi:hypothetical protein
LVRNFAQHGEGDRELGIGHDSDWIKVIRVADDYEPATKITLRQRRYLVEGVVSPPSASDSILADSSRPNPITSSLTIPPASLRSDLFDSASLETVIAFTQEH